MDYVTYHKPKLMSLEIKNFKLNKNDKIFPIIYLILKYIKEKIFMNAIILH